MSVKISFLYGTALAVASSLPAISSNLPKQPAPITPSPKVVPLSWTGFSIGIGGAGQTFKSDHLAASEGYSLDESGRNSTMAIGTVEARANYQSGNIVVGLIANYDLGKASVKATDGTVGNDGFLRTSLDIDSAFTLGGRIGVLSAEHLLLYASGGYSSADVTAYGFREDTGPDVEVTSTGRKSGYFVGAGAEYAFANNLSLSVEYRYSDYGNMHIETTDDAGLSANFRDINQQSLRAVLGWKF